MGKKLGLSVKSADFNYHRSDKGMRNMAWKRLDKDTMQKIEDLQNEYYHKGEDKIYGGKAHLSTTPFSDMAKKSASWSKINMNQNKIERKCKEITDMLLQKNAQYGDSVLSPNRIFSKAATDEQIKVRIDDKLNRLIKGDDSMETDDDIIKDLIGYLILLLVHADEQDSTQVQTEDNKTTE